MIRNFLCCLVCVASLVLTGCGAPQDDSISLEEIQTITEEIHTTDNIFELRFRTSIRIRDLLKSR